MNLLSYDFFHLRRRRFIKQIKQFTRYLSVGALMLWVNLIGVWFFVEIFDMQYLTACGITFAGESLLAFYVNKYWTFKSSVSFRSGFKRFFLIGFYTTLLILSITYGLTHFLSFRYAEARTTSTAIMGVVGYILDMKLAFKM